MSESIRLRLHFTKEGRARFISHLDLMHTLQRSFFRAGIPLCYSKGYNPHALLWLALPLSVGYGSVCELADFSVGAGLTRPHTDATNGRASPAPMIDTLNAALPEGLRGISIGDADKPFREIAFVNYELTMHYDAGVPAGAADGMLALLRQDELLVMKRTKKAGEQETDIRPAIHRVNGFRTTDNTLVFTALLEAQEPGLNPAYITAAAKRYRSDLTPDFVNYTRLTLHGKEMELF
jgi:radical SAM-linked protein